MCVMMRCGAAAEARIWRRIYETKICGWGHGIQDIGPGPPWNWGRPKTSQKTHQYNFAPPTNLCSLTTSASAPPPSAFTILDRRRNCIFEPDSLESVWLSFLNPLTLSTCEAFHWSLKAASKRSGYGQAHRCNTKARHVCTPCLRIHTRVWGPPAKMSGGDPQACALAKFGKWMWKHTD